MSKDSVIILGIETSCDETAAAVIEVTDGNFLLRSNVVASQIDIHKQYGGVVPEVAARNHVTAIAPVIDKALRDADIQLTELDRIAVTAGPGLISSLLVGVQTAKSLAVVTGISLVPISHMRAHLYAAYLSGQPIVYPALGLIVSGGHTELILMQDETDLKKIGATVDDAAGEAFDKVAAMLKLPYPGGPSISKIAKNGDAAKYDFPRPMLESGDFKFSFSGLKTAVLYTLKDIRWKSKKKVGNIAASFEDAVVDVLVAKTKQAAELFDVKTVIVAGGVAANRRLRERLTQTIARTLIIPEAKFCTDNAAMVAVAGYFGQTVDPHTVTVNANWEILS